MAVRPPREYTIEERWEQDGPIGMMPNGELRIVTGDPDEDDESDIVDAAPEEEELKKPEQRRQTPRERGARYVWNEEDVEIGPPPSKQRDAFDPDQDRDETGKWTTGGGGAAPEKEKEKEKTPRRSARAEAKAENAKNLNSSFDKHEKTALKYYSKNIYKDINAELRGIPRTAKAEKNFPKSQAAAYTAALDRAFGRAETKEDSTTFRAVSKATLDKMMAAGGFKDNGYASTSSSSRIAEKFGRDEKGSGGYAVINLDIPKGSRAIFMAEHSDYPDEREVLLDRGSVWERQPDRDGRPTFRLTRTHNVRDAAKRERKQTPKQRSDRYVWNEEDVEIGPPSPKPEPTPKRDAFDPDQDRDESGKWTSGGGSGVGEEELEEEAPELESEEDDFVGEAEENNAKNGQGDLTPDEEEALEMYSQAGYSDINDHLRHDTPAVSEIRGAIRNLDRALEKFSSQEEVTLFRAVSMRTLEKMVAAGVFSDRGFLSATHDIDAADEFGKENKGSGSYAIVNLVVPPGSRILYMAAKSAYPEEREVLVARGTVWQKQPDVNGRPTFRLTQR